MADEVRVTDAEAEEAGEAIHLPGPSFQPVLVAFGLALTVTGVVLSPVLVVIGLVITVITIVRWIRDTRSDISELPLEH
jgi:Flp pilus assembly protein TadB